LRVEWDKNFHPLLFPLHVVEWQHFWLHIPFFAFKRAFLYCLNRKICLRIVSSLPLRGIATSVSAVQSFLDWRTWQSFYQIPILYFFNINILSSLSTGMSIICIFFIFVFLKTAFKTYSKISKQMYCSFYNGFSVWYV
jgi:hypothetical protein